MGSVDETVCLMAGFCSCKTCTSTIHGGRMRHPSVHGRIYSVSQATDPNSCLGWYKYSIIKTVQGL